ncbi:hypothetical protein CGLO_00380 [Colletotrichum gloeosporioides Cg-14]|uniref:Uncharacterized protein n=1 Tax=Colletotrichum gloeosporioides (strain Cg-14) TaxID=1237896 RepID=T0M6Z5_COLGC|nr:hypothetical protein CGLO_00380 [Colletotrichum gloeosporioides Cg-14]
MALSRNAPWFWVLIRAATAHRGGLLRL